MRAGPAAGCRGLRPAASPTRARLELALLIALAQRRKEGQEQAADRKDRTVSAASARRSALRLSSSTSSCARARPGSQRARLGERLGQSPAIRARHLPPEHRRPAARRRGRAAGAGAAASGGSKAPAPATPRAARHGAAPAPSSAVRPRPSAATGVTIMPVNSAHGHEQERRQRRGDQHQLEIALAPAAEQQRRAARRHAQRVADAFRRRSAGAPGSRVGTAAKLLACTGSNRPFEAASV